jgi:hypothetical protein
MKTRRPGKKKGKEKRKEALLSVVGIWKDRTDLPDTETYIRGLRKGKRLARLT